VKFFFFVNFCISQSLVIKFTQVLLLEQEEKKRLFFLFSLLGKNQPESE